jgi:hypothetical protein
MKVFDYISELDAFVVNKQFDEVCDKLNISEWSSVVWLGRFFARDNDFGEHWFDNWDEREVVEAKAKELGLDYKYDELLIVVPERFKDERGEYCFECKQSHRRLPCATPGCEHEVFVGADGPCHSDELIKQFWTEVLKSLDLSLDFIIAHARENNAQWMESYEKRGLTDTKDYEFYKNIESVIQEVRNVYG